MRGHIFVFLIFIHKIYFCVSQYQTFDNGVKIEPLNTATGLVRVYYGETVRQKHLNGIIKEVTLTNVPGSKLLGKATTLRYKTHTGSPGIRFLFK